MLLIPNLGAEENDEWGVDAESARPRPHPAHSHTAARLFGALFGAGAHFSDERQRADAPLPAPDHAEPAFAWLAPGDREAVAWLGTIAARAEAERAGHSLWGADPQVVRAVHDKAFAHEIAREDGWLPGDLADLVAVIEPDALREASAARAIEARVEAWPSWTGGRFTLKPRLATSGRGRVPGEPGQSLAEAGPARLASAGGALLEPWLDRIEDLSASLWIAPDRQLTLLGTTRLLVARSGLYRGQRGFVDSRGRVTSGSEHDEALREAAVGMASRAAAAGYWGPCGVDAFAFRGAIGEPVFRPVVEWNARFTLGIVAIGWLRRLLPRLRDGLLVAPDLRRPFQFTLAPPQGWSDVGARDGFAIVARASPSPWPAPGLVVAEDEPTLDRLCVDGVG
jgi:hypothetical protein